MTVQQTELFRELQAIMGDGVKPVTAMWEVTIHANGKDHKPLFVDLVEFEHNFMKNWHSVQVIEATFTLAQADYHIVPHRSELELTLKRIPMMESETPSKDAQGRVSSFRYKAKLYDNSSSIMTGNSPAAVSEAVADRGELRKLRIQLISPHTEELHKKSVGGMFRQVSGINLIRLLLTKYSRTDVTDENTYIKGVQVAPNANEKVMEHINIPHLTPIHECPEIVHRNCGGVYGAGLKTYLWGQHWYVFAPYDVKAYGQTKRTLTILNVQANRMSGMERTYRETATQLFIAATGDTVHKDESEQEQLNFGNGVRFVDAGKITDGFLTVDGNKATIDRSLNVNEVVVTPRKDGLNQIKESDKRITSAYLLEYGNLALRSGSFLQVVWEYSNALLLYPGMPVKYMYSQNAVAEEVYGILLGVHTFHMPTTQNTQNRRFTSKSVLTLFVQRDVNLSNLNT